MYEAFAADAGRCVPRRQMPYQSNIMGRRSAFLGLGASVRGDEPPRAEAPFLASVPLLARALRLGHLAVLKMDCEGCECAALLEHQSAHRGWRGLELAEIRSFHPCDRVELLGGL